MPCIQGPCQAGKLQNEGRNIGQNNEIPTIQNEFVQTKESEAVRSIIKLKIRLNVAAT